jgi:chromosome segregation ATPase
MDLQEEIDGLNRLVVAKDQQLTDLQSELTTQRQAHIEDRKKVIAKDAQLDTLLEKLRSHQYCENKIKAMETELDESRRYQTALETAVDNETKLYHDLEDDLAWLKVQAVEDLKKSREEGEAEGKHKSDHVEALEAELKELRFQITELSNERESMENRILQLLMELSNANDSLEGFRKDKQEMAETAKNLIRTLETATRQCSLFVVSTDDTGPTSSSSRPGGSTAAERSRGTNAAGSTLDSSDLQNGHETASQPMASRSRGPGHSTVWALAALIIAGIDRV